MIEENKKSIDNLIACQYDEFIVSVKGFILIDSDIKKLYDSLKSNYKDVNVTIINANLVYGFNHLNGVLKIIDEEKRRRCNIQIKNIEIEFLLRMCYTNQITKALKINQLEEQNKNFVFVLFANNKNSISNIFNTIGQIGTEANELILATEAKKSYIIDLFFKDKIKDRNIPIIKDDGKFIKFLVERAAIAML